ncbi:hypothetical protein IAG44_40690 [Streptomyces roseirectus]|uniref:SH3b domain-containing protein n=1 Tax=Streptomyces roseirectus TaxID=2768066 RepID=A0A7H0IQP4_9ACTN|nr:hypothetical protein [Streptomyces roseirectus]QNP75110.1 hypothetical protein IAG44_40690 [Streptomyces roseirectus]
MIEDSRSRLTRGGLAFAAVAALAVPTAVVVGTAGTASAVPCSQSGPDRDTTPRVRMTAGVSANMRGGPGTGCDVVGWADRQDLLDYRCYVYVGSSSWTYLYNVTDARYGWVADSLLPRYGADSHC